MTRAVIDAAVADLVNFMDYVAEPHKAKASDRHHCPVPAWLPAPRLRAQEGILERCALGTFDPHRALRAHCVVARVTSKADHKPALYLPRT